MKKIISLLLTLMLICAFCTPAFAMTANAADETRVSDAVTYLEKTFTGGSVVTETKELSSYIPVTADTPNLAAVPGASETWYFVDNDITFSERMEVTGDVNLLLLNGISLTANKGITLEEGNSLTVYAQSDDPAVMGQIIADSNNGDAGIGGRAGKDGTREFKRGENGRSAGAFCQKGGKITVTATGSACIGGGNAGNGRDAETSAELGGSGGYGGEGGAVQFYGGITALVGEVGIGGGRGGNGGDTCYGPPGTGGHGGRWLDVTVYGGSISISSSNGVCIGGGNGGNGGDTEESISGSGGEAGGLATITGRLVDSFSSISFLGGTVEAQSLTDFCFGCGKSGKSGAGGYHMGADGKSGDPAEITTGEGAEIIAGDDSKSAAGVSGYSDQKYVKISYPQADKSNEISPNASILSSGYPWTVVAVAVAAAAAAVALCRKKKPVPSNSTSADDEE